ncbi:sucrose-phosphate synthase 4 isoform X2 [Rhododendron vialii]|uniref:sucrose-phosphate synthase 4 isoform X2 n=1 Tax=Rhododendron vialii TaxID=182163 RepID=UPI00265DDA44|nr:sucrose-phosphate synthase 4 isoform X2 [Rhododendron vialii]
MAAGNEWINGYLEAILDVGNNSSKSSSSSSNNIFGVKNIISGSNITKGIEETKLKIDQGFDSTSIGDEDHKDKEVNDPQKLISPIKYFVEEVVNSFDESDLHRTWIKVIATRNSRERNNRLENMCWRIWHLARKKKQIAWDDAQKLMKRRIEIERGRNDAAEDLSELSEGEKEKSDANQAESPPDKISRINSDMQIWSDDDKPRHLYIVLIRYIQKESLWPYIPEFVDGALSHIVNMSSVLGEQVDGGKTTWPYVIHGHYADAGEVAAHLSGALNVPMVLTGHSLGRNKFEQLLKQGRLSREDINSMYKIMRRIEAEEMGLDAAEMVVTSTRQEIDEQWGLYDGFDIKLERKLRVRRRRGVSCHGRYMPRMVVIPPGMDFSYVTPQDSLEGDGDLTLLIDSNKTQNKRHMPLIWSEITKFFTNPHKPMILALSRPDPKKNVTTLLKAFGECQPLKELANLTLILGNRDDIEEMSNSSSVVLTTVLKLIDKYNLYGMVAYPKHHKQSEVPEIYQLAAKTKGVFINPALVEPFGLTLIEAAAYGLPVVATRNGGPVDIIKALNNGLLIDPHDHKAIADALLKLVADKNLWLECRKNGLKYIHRYSWPEHCRTYLSHVKHCRNRHPTTRLEIIPTPEEPMSDSLRDVEDISLKFSVDTDFKPHGEIDAANRQRKLIEALTHLGSPHGNSSISYGPGRRKELFIIATDCFAKDGLCTETLPLVTKNVMQAAVSSSGKVGFVLLTGLTLHETKEIFRNCHVGLETFDALVCNSGSEMYYPWRDSSADMDYEAHIGYKWPGENVGSMIMRLGRVGEGDGNGDDIAEYSDAFSSRCYSYSIKPGAMTRKIDELRQRLRMRGFRCSLVYTHATTRLNVVPLLASRGQALRYLSVRWGLDLSKMVVFVGEKGDTDYEGLLVGLHKTVVLRNSVEYGSEMLLRSEESYKRDDVVPQDSPRIAFVEDHQFHNISAALKALQIM